MESHHARVLSSVVGHRTASALAGVAVVAVLVVQLNTVRSDSDTAVVAVAAAEQASISAPRIEPREPVELRARSDIRAYAIRNALPVDAEEGFTVLPEWREQWSLVHVDVRAGDEVVRIYEAVSRRDPKRRFIAMWEPGSDRATPWQLVLE